MKLHIPVRLRRTVVMVLAYVSTTFLTGCFGDPPPHPYRDPAALRSDAQALSDNLEAFVRA